MWVNVNILNELVRTLASKTEADMNNYASSTATDFMEAYYKVSMIEASRAQILTT
jgi:hypothetical protein